MADSETEAVAALCPTSQDFEQADVYDKNAHRHVNTLAEILETFQKALPPCENDQQQVIDVGCGPGGFTRRYLLPSCLPCRRLVAVDKSPAMLRFAAEKNPHPKLHYLPLDIAQDVDSFVDREGQFQRLYSFLTLHWVRDQRHAMRNINKLMAPGGDCILLFKTSSHFFSLFTALIKSPRWMKYSQVLEDLIPETANVSDIGALRMYAKDLVSSTSLTPLSCEVFLPPKELSWSTETMTESFLSFNPLYQLLNDAEREELKEYIKNFTATMCIENFNQRPSNRLLILIHACKPLSAGNVVTAVATVKPNE